MKGRPLAVLLVVVGLLMVSGAAFAHHSAAGIYDLNREVILKGTATKFAFANPHTKLHFQVKDDQENVEQWVGEMAPPNNLRRAGWNRNTIKPGDQITATVHVARDDSKRADIVTLVVNGKELRGRRGEETE